jgi:hypothetical protein
VPVDRVDDLHVLAQVLAEHLHVPRLIEGLRRRVQLGVVRRRAGHELRSDEQSALLTVQELRDSPRVRVPRELVLALGRELVEARPTRVRVLAVSDHRRLGLWVAAIPVHVELGVPIALFTQAVELADALVGLFVVPVVRAG